MDDLLKKYAAKLVAAGLAAARGPGAPLMGGLDRDLTWNRPAPEIPVLTPVFQHLNINSLAFVRPAPPYDRIIGFLADRALTGTGRTGLEGTGFLPGRIVPEDCETRTFLHDLPVVDAFDAHTVIQALKQRKTVIVREKGGVNGPAVIAPGTVSPEQGFVHISSVCFACFVKFFSDFLAGLKNGRSDPEMAAVFDRTVPFLSTPSPGPPDLAPGPFTREKQVIDAMVETGRHLVADGLVDSYFGNISCCWHDTLYISQTGASLDALDGCIDPVPLDGSSSAGITASSELSAHLETVARTGCGTLLHGHPRFSVILSMDCDPDQKAGCAHQHQCHTLCPASRTVGKTPVVPGEVGTGPFGLCRTLPRAFENSDTVIVYGHGVFAAGQTDFIQAYASMAAVENFSKTRYLEMIRHLRGVGHGNPIP